MMFFYHFFAFPDLQPENCHYLVLGYYKGVPIEQIIAPFGQLCVALFAFNTGFVICKNYENYSKYSLVLKRLLKFLIAYWIICLLFILYGIIAGKELPSIVMLLKNLVGRGLSARVSYINVAHAWYVSYYIVLMLFAPILSRMGKIINPILDLSIYIVFLVVIPYLPGSLLNIIWPISATVMGFLVCKYQFFYKIRSLKMMNNSITAISISIILVILTVLFRHEFSYYNIWGRLDGMYSALFISAILLLYKVIPQYITKIIVWVGTMSMYLWFLHSIFVMNEALLTVLYFPYIPIIITIWGIILMAFPAFICKKMSGSLEHIFIAKN